MRTSVSRLLRLSVVSLMLVALGLLQHCDRASLAPRPVLSNPAQSTAANLEEVFDEGATTRLDDPRLIGAPSSAIGDDLDYPSSEWFATGNRKNHRSNSPEPVEGLSYLFESFDNGRSPINAFGGNWSGFNEEMIATTFDTSVRMGDSGAALRVDYAVPEDRYAGIWHSLWGRSDITRTHIDFTDIYGDLSGVDRDFEQIQFWVRGSGKSGTTHKIKVELKDNVGAAAYSQIKIEDSDTTWQQIVLDADVTNATYWEYSPVEGVPPDPTRMKQLVFVVEGSHNDPTGTFYVDDIRFVDADDHPFVLEQATDDEFLELVGQRTFLYFLDWYDPQTGLYRDRSVYPDLFSIASTGFGLTSLVIGEERGWVDRDEAVERVKRTLQSLDDLHPAGPVDASQVASGTNGYRGFYYHFLDEQGVRKFDNSGVGSELSPVDTAILLAGVLTVREHFDDVPEIVSLADKLYAKTDWQWMLDDRSNLFYLAWKPEQDLSGGYVDGSLELGYFSLHHWDYYTDEVVLINLLAIASPEKPVPADVFCAWRREPAANGSDELVHSWNGSFFTYVFAHLWFDLKTLGEDGHPSRRVDWWKNSVEAAEANWQFAVDHEDDAACDGDDDYLTYGETSWGLTACDGPDDSYHAYGAPPVDLRSEAEHDGTIAPYGAGMAAMLLPEKAVPSLKHYFGHEELWHYRLGYGDAYNLDPPDCGEPWYNRSRFGIDQGPMLIGIEHQRSRLIWDTLSRNDDLQRALDEVKNVHCATITGPRSAMAFKEHRFTAHVGPSTLTGPITYTWRVSGRQTGLHVSELLTDTLDYKWTTGGRRTISVTVESAVGTVTGRHVVDTPVYAPIGYRKQ